MNKKQTKHDAKMRCQSKQPQIDFEHHQLLLISLFSSDGIKNITRTRICNYAKSIVVCYR